MTFYATFFFCSGITILRFTQTCHHTTSQIDYRWPVLGNHIV